MSGAIIHDPEDAASGLVRLLAHYFTDEALNRGHPVFDFAAAEDLGAMNVPGRQIGPGAFAKVLARPSWGGSARAATSAVFGVELEYSSSRPPRSRSHQHPMERPPKCARRGRGRGRLWQQNWDPEGRSSFDVAKAGERRC